MSKIECEIIKDLLPLYVDNVCSEESRKMVEEHLAKCSSCRCELEEIQDDIKISGDAVKNNLNDSNTIKAISTLWNRSKIKAFMKGVILTALSLGIIFLIYFGLFQWNIVAVPADVVEITDVSQLADGRIAYHFRLTDGYDLNEIRYDMDEAGNFYLTPYRPIVKARPIADIGLINMYDTLNQVQISAYQEKYGEHAEITALYVRTRDDNILIWKKGMELPAASDKVEAQFNVNE